MPKSKNTRTRLTDSERRLILSTIEEAGSIRAAVRLLAERGTPFGYGTVQKTGREFQTGETADSRLATLEARVRSLNTTVTGQRRLLGESLDFNDEVLAAIGTLAPAAKRHIGIGGDITKEVISGTETAAVALWSDFHIGEMIEACEVGGFNEFNWAIAQARFHYLINKMVLWVKTERSGHNIQDLHIALLGDFITGDIHEGLKITNEFPAPVAVVHAASLLAEGVRALAPHFRNVYLWELLQDNHSRLTHKIQWQGGYKNTMNYPLYALVNAQLADHPNVAPTLLTGVKSQVSINNQEILFGHGHTVRAWMGLPYYGMEREEGREARLRLKKGKPYSLHAKGHWHHAAVGPFGVLNGSLCGMTAFDAQAGRYAPPCQVSFLLHPEHGMFNWVPWNLEPASCEK